MKLTPKIILEGTRLTHKTDIAFALNEHPAIVGTRKYRYHSPIVSGEWCGFTSTPWGRGIINFDPEELDLALDTYDSWLRLIEHLPYYSWIIDRFHISTLVHQQSAGSLGPDAMTRLLHGLDTIEERLDRLGFRQVLCVRTPDSFEKAREERLPVSGNPAQYDDPEVFIDEQELMKELAGRSRLPTLVLDVSDDDVDGAVEKIAAWLEETGGLHPPTERDW